MKRTLLYVLLFLASLAQAQTHTVRPGETIQGAVAKAKPGDVIEVEPGIYKESVVVDKPGITLRGKTENGAWPTLEGEGTRNDGLIASGSQFIMEYFRVQNYKGNGVMSQGADDVVLRKLQVKDTGIYGIYPTRGKNVLVEETVSWGIADAAIYIGMCENSVVRRNEVFGNVAGIEIENSKHIIVEDNSAHHNAAGILVFNLPGLPIKDGADCVIRNNYVVANNHKNFGPEGSIVASTPSGSGIILMAADKVRVENNIIQDNQSGGIIIADHEYIKDVAAPDPLVDPNPDDNQILYNEFQNNGTKPQGMLKYALWFQFFTLRGRDILFAGKGKNNCLLKDLKGSTKGTEAMAACDPKATTADAVAKLKPFQSHHKAAPAMNGEMVYQTVCAGCHAVGMTRIGPPIEEIQKKYPGQPEKIVAFATKPQKVRPNFPEMPSQAYLGEKKLRAVAEYLLKMK